MKKFLVSTAIVAIIGFSSAVMAENNVAVIDVQAVVAKSAQVQALKKEQKTKLQDLEKWVKVCKSDIEKQKTQEGKDKLVKKYDADLKKKQKDIKDDYAKKIQNINKSIVETISNEAKAKGYDMVLTKGAVLYGGTDITADIIKIVK